jgi:hypothetical protein
VKINVDASFYKETNITGLGIIARGEKRNVILASAKVQFDCSDAEEAELPTYRDALLLAIGSSSSYIMDS